MSRPVRVEFPGACYHVMSHGVNGAPTFVDDLDHRTFVDSLKEFVVIGKLIVFAFILMRTYFHLLLQTPMAGLSRHMQKLLGSYTGLFNRRHHRHGRLWQARYKAVVVQDGDYFLPRVPVFESGRRLVYVHDFWAITPPIQFSLP